MTQHKGVSAAEKYAELEARGEERPQCECHGETQYWQKSERVLAGGCWVCASKRRERDRERYTNDAGYRKRKLERGRERYASDAEFRERKLEWERERHASDAEYREQKRERKRRLIEAGLCANCGKAPTATAGGWRCNPCLDKLITPERLLALRRHKALKRREKRHQTGRVNGEISPQV